MSYTSYRDVFRRFRRYRRYRNAHQARRTKLLSYCAVLFMARRRRAGGAGRTSPCRGVGQRPTPFQFSNHPISQSTQIPFVSLAVEGLSLRACTVSFVISKYSDSLREPSWFFVPLRVSPAGRTSHVLPAPRPSRACRALRSLFSVLCSPFFYGTAQKAPAETAGARARGYKPSSVPLRAPIIKLSTQPADSAEAVVGASSASPPIWACSGRGLPCAGAFTHRRWALTPPFHPYRPKAAVCLCGTFRRAGLPRAHRPLQPVFPLCGVRTFLPLARAIGHPGTKGG